MTAQSEVEQLSKITIPMDPVYGFYRCPENTAEFTIEVMVKDYFWVFVAGMKGDGNKEVVCSQPDAEWFRIIAFARSGEWVAFQRFKVVDRAIRVCRDWQRNGWGTKRVVVME